MILTKIIQAGYCHHGRAKLRPVVVFEGLSCQAVDKVLLQIVGCENIFLALKEEDQGLGFRVQGPGSWFRHVMASRKTANLALFVKRWANRRANVNIDWYVCWAVIEYYLGWLKG